MNPNSPDSALSATSLLPCLSRQSARSFLLRNFAPSLFLLFLFPVGTLAAQPQLRWDNQKGVILQAGEREVRWGGSASGGSLRLSFPSASVIQTLRTPSVAVPEPGQLLLVYAAESPDGVPLSIERRLAAQTDRNGVALIETFRLTPARPLTNDIEIEIPFTVGGNHQSRPETHENAGSR